MLHGNKISKIIILFWKKKSNQTNPITNIEFQRKSVSSIEDFQVTTFNESQLVKSISLLIFFMNEKLKRWN